MFRSRRQPSDAYAPRGNDNALDGGRGRKTRPGSWAQDICPVSHSSSLAPLTNRPIVKHAVNAIVDIHRALACPVGAAFDDEAFMTIPLLSGCRPISTIWRRGQRDCLS